MQDRDTPKQLTVKMNDDQSFTVYWGMAEGFVLDQDCKIIVEEGAYPSYERLETFARGYFRGRMDHEKYPLRVRGTMTYYGAPCYPSLVKVGDIFKYPILRKHQIPQMMDVLRGKTVAWTWPEKGEVTVTDDMTIDDLTFPLTVVAL